MPMTMGFREHLCDWSMKRRPLIPWLVLLGAVIALLFLIERSNAAWDNCSHLKVHSDHALEGKEEMVEGGIMGN